MNRFEDGRYRYKGRPAIMLYKYVYDVMKADVLPVGYTLGGIHKIMLGMFNEGMISEEEHYMLRRDLCSYDPIRKVNSTFEAFGKSKLFIRQYSSKIIEPMDTDKHPLWWLPMDRNMNNPNRLVRLEFLESIIIELDKLFLDKRRIPVVKRDYIKDFSVETLDTKLRIDKRYPEVLNKTKSNEKQIRPKIGCEMGRLITQDKYLYDDYGRLKS